MIDVRDETTGSAYSDGVNRTGFCRDSASWFHAAGLAASC